MPLEFSELAGGLPFALSFAMASGITALREGRRRTSLNEAMHELRRPLQGLALSLPTGASPDGRVDSCLQMTIAAVERLDREINGGAAPASGGRWQMRLLVMGAMERWQGPAAAAERPLTLDWRAGEAELQIDPVAVAQALDNLISNAFSHGSGAVVVEIGETCGLVRIAVRDGGCATSPEGRSVRLRDRLAGRERHGHGLRIVRRLAARHGGGFRLRCSSSGTEARLDLPRAGEER